jgi:amino-acid N-acetyltransferase
MMNTVIRDLGAEDRAAVHALLRSHKLPLAGFDDAHVRALVAKDGPAVVGSAAVELHGPDGLLRSVAVADDYRGRSLGAQLTIAAIALAREQQLSALYLLTETAAAFFPKFGFVPVSREDIPDRVKQSVEFTSACPAGAQAFRLSLNN